MAKKPNPVAPRKEPLVRPPDDRVSLRVIADTEQIHAGQTFHLAFVFNIKAGMHIGWQNPGGDTAPTTVTVTGPDGFLTGETLYPRPMKIVTTGEAVIGYTRQTVLFVPVTVPDRVPARIAFRAVIRYSAGREDQRKRTEIRTVSFPSGWTASDREVIRSFRRQIPEPIRRLAGCSVKFVGRTLTITGPLPPLKKVGFFGYADAGVTIRSSEILTGRDIFRIDASVGLRPEETTRRPMRIRGLVTIGDATYSFEAEFEPLE